MGRQAIMHAGQDEHVAQPAVNRFAMVRNALARCDRTFSLSAEMRSSMWRRGSRSHSAGKNKFCCVVRTKQYRTLVRMTHMSFISVNDAPGLGRGVYAHRDKLASSLIFGKACENKAFLTASEHRARGCPTSGDRQKVEHNSTRSGKLPCLWERYLFLETQRAARTARGQIPL